MWVFLKKFIFNNGVMRMSEVFWIIAGLLLYACNSDVTVIKGEIEGLEGKITLAMIEPQTNDTVVIAEQDVVDGKIDLKSKGVSEPAWVWLNLDKGRSIDFIIDSHRKIQIEGSLADIGRISVTGSDLAEEYVFLQQLLEERYDMPLAELEKMIHNLQRREVLNSRGEFILASYRRRLEKFKRYRFEYIEKLIEMNPSQELSLFLIWDELKDSADVQKRLFESMCIENKESNIYQLLTERLQ